jgi:fluoride exporter
VTITTYLLVAVGSATGGICRYLTNLAVAQAMGTHFPWGTFAVNLSGALVAGVLAGIPGMALSSEAWLLLIIGLCGSYTTVSAFSLQSLELLSSGRHGAAAINILGSGLACLAAVWLGRTASMALLGAPT